MRLSRREIRPTEPDNKRAAVVAVRTTTTLTHDKGVKIHVTGYGRQYHQIPSSAGKAD